MIDRVTIGRTAIQVQLSEAVEGAEADGVRSLMLPWAPPSPYRKREIIQGVADRKTSARPMRANARAIFVDALGEAHRWLDELTLESLAVREGKTERSIRMTLSIAFLAPDITKAAVEGRLPRGYAPDLEPLIDAYEVELKEAGVTDWPGVLTLASEAASVVGGNRPRLIGLPTLFLDVPIGNEAEFVFVGSLTAAAPEVLATVPTAEPPTLRYLSDRLRAQVDDLDQRPVGKALPSSPSATIMPTPGRFFSS